MIKDNQNFFNRLHIFIDVIVIAFSYYLAWYIKFKSGLVESVKLPGVDFEYYMLLLLVLDLLPKINMMLNLKY